MTLRLNGSTSGYTEIDAPASAGNNTLLLPTGNGSAGNILGTDGAGNLSWVNGRMVLETAKTATGSAVEFTGLPSWAKRMTVMFDGVSTNGTELIRFRLGSASAYAITGYKSYSSILGVSSIASGANSTTGFELARGAAAAIRSGSATFCLIGNNIWSCNGFFGSSDIANGEIIAGSVSLSGALTRLIVNTVGATNTFDAGQINILYEG